jgi:hypothetical protein
MDTYIRIYDQNKRGDDDNPTIGLILCSQKSEAVAKYSVLTDTDGRYATTKTIRKFRARWRDEELSEAHFHTIKNMPLKAGAPQSFFEDESITEAMIQAWKADLRFFTNLRKIARQDAQETVDYSSYEEQIRRLVDKQVIGNETRMRKAFMSSTNWAVRNPANGPKRRPATRPILFVRAPGKALSRSWQTTPGRKKPFPSC